MKHKLKLLVLLLVILSISACSKNKRYSKLSENLYKQGNFHAATLMAIESLKLKPTNPQAQQSLKDAYPRALQAHRNDVNQLKEEKNSANWPKILKSYEAMEQLSIMLKSLPTLQDSNSGESIRFDIYNYGQEIAEAKRESAEHYYKEAMHLSRMSADRDTQKKAALTFKEAQKYVSGYKDSEMQYQEARRKAVVRIAVLAFEDKSGSRGRYGALSELLMEQIISELFQARNANEFVEIISRDQIDKVLSEQQLSASGMIDESSSARIGMLLGAHEILSGKILQIDYSAPRITSVDLIDKAELSVETEDGEREEKQEVECSITKYSKHTSLKAVVSYSVVDVSTGKINHQHSFNASKSFTDEWAKFVGGDRRALSSVNKALVNKMEPLAPTDKELANSAMKELADDIITDFRRYLR